VHYVLRSGFFILMSSRLSWTLRITCSFGASGVVDEMQLDHALWAFDKGYLIHIHIYWMPSDGRQPLPF
jgi:hypothetical protein